MQLTIKSVFFTPGIFNSDIWAIERAPDGKPWVTDIREYIEDQTYPEHERKMIRRQSGGWQCNSLCVGAISIKAPTMGFYFYV